MQMPNTLYPKQTKSLFSLWEITRSPSCQSFEIFKPEIKLMTTSDPLVRLRITRSKIEMCWRGIVKQSLTH